MHLIPQGPLKQDVAIQVPGSKSYTHRMLIAAALSNGACGISNPLKSEDTMLTFNALKQLGVQGSERQNGFQIQGVNGRFQPSDTPIYLANAGTSMRLLAAAVVLGRGIYHLTGTPRMCERPMQPLLDSLNELGVEARALEGNGCPPIAITAGNRQGGRARIDCSVSSQFLSALMLIAPCLPRGMILDVTRGPVSKPYIDLTVDIMETFGIRLDRAGYDHFDIKGNQTYRCGDYTVESDGSQASYFWAAAAVTGNRVKVKNITKASRQGDVALSGVFEQMGCRVEHETDGIAVTGGASLRAIEVDMSDMPDVAPTLAVVAAFAQGTSRLYNVAHLRAKECDRLAAVSRELAKMGIETATTDNELFITGGAAAGAEIDTYDDHRMAMSFAIAGLRVPGIVIMNETCVKKSFPDFWRVFNQLYA